MSEEMSENIRQVETQNWIEELASLICSMSGWLRHEAKDIIYWCVATYGYAEIRRFPILMFMGRKGSGKTTALNIVMELSKMPPGTKERDDMILNPDLSKAVSRDKIAEGGTHVAEEADKFPEMVVNKVFDKFTGKATLNQPVGDNKFRKVEIKISTALAIHRRKHFKDEATTSRCIVMYTRKVNLGDEGKQNPDMRLIREYLGRVEELAELLKDSWTEIPEIDSSRERELWNPLKHIAEKVGDSDYVSHVEREISDAIALEAEMELDETDPAVFRTIFESVYTQGRYADRVTTKSVREKLKEDDIYMTSQNINRTARHIGFEVKNEAGRMYIKLHKKTELRRAQMQRIAKKVGYEDEALKD